MAMRDLVNHIVAANAFTSANIKNTTAGVTVNTLGFEGVAFEVFVGVLGDTLSGTTSYEFDVQESNDGSTWTASAAINIQYVQTGAANANAGGFLNSGASGTAAQVLPIGYLGNAQYVRLNVVVVGTMTNGTVISAVAILGNARHKPAQNIQLP